MTSAPAVSSQMQRNGLNSPMTDAEETDEGNRGHANNVSSHVDVPTPQRTTRRPSSRGFTGDGASSSTPRPGGWATEWHDQWNHDVWVDTMPTRQRGNNDEYRRHREERRFVRYVPPVYSDSVHVRSNCRHPVDEFPAYRRDFRSASGQTVDL